MTIHSDRSGKVNLTKNEGNSSGVGSFRETDFDLITGLQVDDFPSHGTVTGDMYNGFRAFSSINDEPKLRQRIEKYIKELGFSHYSFTRLDRVEKGTQITNLPEGLINSYFENGFQNFDISVLHAKNNRCSFFSSAITEYMAGAPFSIELTDKQEAITKLYEYYSFYNLFNTVVNSTTGSGNALLSVARVGFTSAGLIKKMAGCERTIKLLCDAIDYTVVRKFPDRYCLEKPSVSINPKPLRVLATLANNDFTIGQVAQKLCISVVTANKHLESVRKALKVRTNYAAIKKSVRMELIQYEE